MKANAHKSEVKEIRFTPNTDDHDFDFKAKHAEKFLREGNKVKTYVQFKGRAIMFKERGELILLKFAERLAEVGALEGMPLMEGKRMIAIFAPKSAKKKPNTPKEPKEPREPKPQKEPRQYIPREETPEPPAAPASRPISAPVRRPIEIKYANRPPAPPTPPAEDKQGDN